MLITRYATAEWEHTTQSVPESSSIVLNDAISEPCAARLPLVSLVVDSVRLRLLIAILQASMSTVTFLSGRIFRVAFQDELSLGLKHHFRVWGERLNEELSILFTIRGRNATLIGIESFASSSEVCSRVSLLYPIDLSSEVEVWFHTASLNFDAILPWLSSLNWLIDRWSILSKFALSRWSLPFFLLLCIASLNLSNSFISWLLLSQDLGRIFRQIQLSLDLLGADRANWDYACLWSQVDGALLNFEGCPQRLAAVFFNHSTLWRIQCLDINVILGWVLVILALLGLVMQRFLELLRAAKFYCTGQGLQLCWSICVVLLWGQFHFILLLSMLLREECSDSLNIFLILFRL